MLIGELSKKTGLSKDTIRFYEKKGLISVPSSMRRDNYYKDYSAQIVDQLLQICAIKALGFTLSEIAIFLNGLKEMNASCKKLVFNLENKVNHIDQQIEKLLKIREQLSETLNRCHSDQCEFEKSKR